MLLKNRDRARGFLHQAVHLLKTRKLSKVNEKAFEEETHPMAYPFTGMHSNTYSSKALRLSITIVQQLKKITPANRKISRAIPAITYAI